MGEHPTVVVTAVRRKAPYTTPQGQGEKKTIINGTETATGGRIVNHAAKSGTSVPRKGISEACHCVTGWEHAYLLTDLVMVLRQMAQDSSPGMFYYAIDRGTRSTRHNIRGRRENGENKRSTHQKRIQRDEFVGL